MRAKTTKPKTKTNKKGPQLMKKVKKLFSPPPPH